VFLANNVHYIIMYNILQRTFDNIIFLVRKHAKWRSITNWMSIINNIVNTIFLRLFIGKQPLNCNNIYES